MANDELTGARRLAWHNRRALAERLAWPDGTVEICEDLDRANPGWEANWHPAERRFSAVHTVRHISFRWATAATAEELTDRMFELDNLAANQRSEWALLQPRGWSVLKSQ